MKSRNFYTLPAVNAEKYGVNLSPASFINFAPFREIDRLVGSLDNRYYRAAKLNLDANALFNHLKDNGVNLKNKD